MTLLFYFPMIVWLGMFGVVQHELRPIRVRVRK